MTLKITKFLGYGVGSVLCVFVCLCVLCWIKERKRERDVSYRYGIDLVVYPVKDLRRESGELSELTHDSGYFRHIHVVEYVLVLLCLTGSIQLLRTILHRTSYVTCQHLIFFCFLFDSTIFEENAFKESSLR